MKTYVVEIDGVPMTILRDADGKFIIPDGWRGIGTALKPANEPICLARKPLIGTVAENVLEHGTGAINIDGCRVETGDVINQPSVRGTLGGETDGWTRPWKSDPQAVADRDRRAREAIAKAEQMGRWPANVIHDGSEEVIAAFPADAPSGGHISRRTKPKSKNTYGDLGCPAEERVGFPDSGSASRFFYSVKADAEDRFGSKHPTVKPIDLIAYLCRLVTPPGGLVLDPFAGSGTTGAACLREGFECLLIEREAEYIPDIMARIELGSADGRHPAVIKHRNVDPAKARGEDLPMFTRPDGSEAA